MNFGKKFFHLDKKQFLYEVLKTWKSFFIAVYTCCWSHHWHAQSCDVHSGTCHFRLDLSRLFLVLPLFYLHAKCKMLLSSILYELLEVKFTEVKQASWAKPEVTCSLIYVRTHSKPRLVRMMDQNGSKFEHFKASQKDCILSKSTFFIRAHWVIYRIR